MAGIQAPKQLRPLSRTGKPKANYVFTLLKVKGYEPFDPIKRAYAQERIRHEDGTWTDVRLTTDLRGVPITRQTVKGELQDVTWYHGPVMAGACQGCGLSNGQARTIIRSTRPARWNYGKDRVPVLQTAGIWHVGCLTVRLQNHGRSGRDTKQSASKVIVSK